MDAGNEPLSLDDVPSCAEAVAVGCDIPQFLIDLEETFGDAASRGFMARLGGKKIFVPAAFRSGDALDRACGPNVAKWIVARTDTPSFTVPIGCAALIVRRRVLIYRMIRLGYSLADIAAAAQCTERAVSLNKKRFRNAGLLPD